MSDKVSIEKGIVHFILELYNEQSITRSSVQLIINKTENFISEIYIPFLSEKLLAEFSYDKSLCNKISLILNENKKPFQHFSTEQLRFKMLKKYSFQLPVKYDLGYQMINNIRTLAQGTHVPLEFTLTSVLEIPGLFQQIKEYMYKLHEEKTVISNITQGRVWRSKYSTTNKTILPLILYYDDFETGNALGSHAGQQALGGVYLSLPCLPPHLVAKLNNIFIASVFYTKHRKSLGNYAVFSKVIENINDLSENGLELHIDGTKETVYFQCILFVGDNLGLNSACGFVESFGKSLRYCRICNATSEQCSLMYEEDSTLLRNREDYENKLRTISLNSTSYDYGIKEECLFNRIKNYHIVENKSVDLMHDICEGVAGYTIAKILTVLIYEQKYFSLATLNNRIDSFNYGDIDIANKPRSIIKEFSKKKINDIFKDKIKLKQSAAEMVCLTRYLSAIIGDLVPENNQYWKIYLSLRNILGILLSPRFVEFDVINVKHLIKKHNQMYIKLFGRLKPKMHFMVHVPEIMRDFGPLLHFWCMPFERKNKNLKDTIISSTSHKNVPWSVCIKSQLQQCFLKEQCVHVKSDVSLGTIDSEHTEIQNFVHGISPAKTYKFINICGKKYSKGSIIVTKVTDNGPLFGQIKEIRHNGEETTILVNDIDNIYFKCHYYAYKVEFQSTTKSISLNDLPRIDPCLLFNLRNEMYIITRYDI